MDISEKDHLSSLPSGFVETNVYEDNAVVSITYENENGDIIRFTQTTSNKANIAVDAEQGEYKILNISEYDVRLYADTGIIHAMWIRDTYLHILLKRT